MSSQNGGPFPSRFDWWMSGLATALVGGFYIDLWAHSHGRVDESFFTPWHAILYAAAFTIGVVLFAKATRSRRQGVSGRYALPHGYVLSLLGAALFVVAGVFDLIWHEIFGFEASVEDLLSPTHLLLATSGVFMVAGPVRSAWARGVPTGFFKSVPWALSLMAVLSILTAFTSYAHPALTSWPSVGGDRAAVESELVVVDVDRGHQVTLNIGIEGDVWLPSVLSDGSIVASAAIDEAGALYVIGPDGSDPKMIWEGEGRFIFPDVSPDEASIAFSARTESGSSEIFIVPVDGGPPTQLTNSGADSWDPSWSTDGSQIVFTSDANGEMSLWLIEADGSELQQITDLEGDERAAQWSPDGSQIVFEIGTPERVNLYAMDVDGSTPTRLTSGAWTDLAPTWSPDGSTIAFASDRDGNLDLYTIPSQGGAATRVVEMPRGHEGWAGVAWTPDGSTLVANSSGWAPAWLDEFNGRVRGISGALIQSALLAGLLLMILSRGSLPTGIFSLIFVTNGALMIVFDDNYWYVIPVALAAIVVEVGLAMTRDWESTRRARLIASGAPAVWYAFYLATLAVVEDEIVWSIHLVAGAPLLSGVVGLLLSLVVYPPSETGRRSRPDHAAV